MIVRFRYCILFFFLLFTFESASNGSIDGISGFYFKNEVKNPLPGALIALYSADDNFLVDYSYSLNNGQFTLKAPNMKGKYYIVATKDQITQRKDIDYDPQNPPKSITIQYKDSENDLAKKVTYFWNKVDYLVTTLIGLSLGILIKWFEYRNKMKKAFTIYISQIKCLTDEILSYSINLREVAEAYGLSEGGSQIRDEKYQEFQRIRDKIKGRIKELEDIKIDLEVIYTIYKGSGLKYYNSFKNTIKDIKIVIGLEPNLVLFLTSEALNERMKPFRDFKNNPLLK